MDAHRGKAMWGHTKKGDICNSRRKGSEEMKITAIQPLKLWKNKLPLFKPHWGFPGGSVVKEYGCNAGNMGLISGSGRSPGEGKGNPLEYSCLENSHRQRSLVGCSPWGHKESDMTKWLSTQHSKLIHCTDPFTTSTRFKVNIWTFYSTHVCEGEDFYSGEKWVLPL